MIRDEWIEDIEYFLKKLEETHPNPYRGYDKDEFYKRVNEIKNQEEISTNKMFQSIAFLTSLLKDAHTTIRMWGEGKKVPIRFQYIDGKLYIVDTTQKNERSLYKEVLLINEVPVKKFTDSIEKYISYETLARKNYILEEILNNRYLLETLDLITGNYYKIAFENDEKIDKIRFNKNEIEDSSAYINPMMYYRGDHNNYDCNYIDEYNTIYVNYRICKEDEEYPIEKLIEDINNFAITGSNNIIVDLRHNNGGNEDVFKPLNNYLKLFCDNGGEIIGLTDNGTFSSACTALVNLINLGATIIGSDTGGTKEARFGNQEMITLPNSKVILGCFKNSYRTMFNNEGVLITVGYGDFETRPTFPMASYSPDIFVLNSIEDLKQGIDIVLETALQYSSKVNIK